MRSRYDVFLNGVSMRSIHPSLIIEDIQHTVAAIKSTTSQLAGRDGAQLLSQYKSGTRVTIVFELHIYSIAERQRACQMVAAWAMAGGILETNDRPGQRLVAACLNPPEIGSALKWTDTLSVTFSSYAHTYWEEKNPAMLTLSGTSGNGTLFVPGNAGNAFVQVTATPTGTMNNLSLVAGNTSMTLTGISATAAAPLTISYGDEYGRMIQSIKRGTVSVLDKRTGFDDLLVPSGKINNFSFTASSNVSVQFRVRGVWL